MDVDELNIFLIVEIKPFKKKSYLVKNRQSII
jgi:hypothetical protein